MSSGPSTPRKNRSRKSLEITLSAEAKEKLEKYVARQEGWHSNWCEYPSDRPTKSGVVEWLILFHLEEPIKCGK